MAAEELFRIRDNFVKKVGKTIIKQLLDQLLQDGILGDEERESILEENKTTADQARVLIDSMRKKGDRASRRMMEHLQDKDPTLYLELDLRLSEDAQPVLRPGQLL